VACTPIYSYSLWQTFAMADPHYGGPSLWRTRIIRCEGDADFVFVVLLLYDKILSIPIKMLKKRSIYS